MASTVTAQARFDLGRVVQHTLGAIRSNAASFALLALLLAGVPAAISATGMAGLFGALPMSPAAPAPNLHAFGFSLSLAGLGVLVSLVSNAVLQGAIIYGSASYLNGKQASFGDCLATGLRRCAPLIGLTLLMLPALVFGFMLFFVPGIMMGLAWIVAAPALVVERTGVFGAFGRSADLTRGRRWPILGLVVIGAIAFSIVQQVTLSVVGLLFVAASPQARLISQLPVSAVLGVVGGVLMSALIAAIYYELRVTREGIGPEALAAVFD